MNFIKNNLKVIIAFIVGMMLAGEIVYAAVSASEISYTTSKNEEIKNVQEALNDLYTRTNTSNYTKNVTAAQINNTYLCDYIPTFLFVKASRTNEEFIVYTRDSCNTFWQPGNLSIEDATAYFTCDENGVKFKNWSTNKGDYNLVVWIIK